MAGLTRDEAERIAQEMAVEKLVSAYRLLGRLFAEVLVLPPVTNALDRAIDVRADWSTFSVTDAERALIVSLTKQED